jgi:hypothetical protein
VNPVQRLIGYVIKNHMLDGTLQKMLLLGFVIVASSSALAQTDWSPIVAGGLMYISKPYSQIVARSQIDESFAPVTLHFIALLQTNAQAKSAQAIVPLPDGKGKEVAQRLCTTCHGTSVWVQQRHTPEQWSAIVDNMVSRGWRPPMTT